LLDVAGVEGRLPVGGALTEERKAGDGLGIEAEMGGADEDEAEVWLRSSLREWGMGLGGERLRSGSGVPTVEARVGGIERSGKRLTAEDGAEAKLRDWVTWLEEVLENSRSVDMPRGLPFWMEDQGKRACSCSLRSCSLRSNSRLMVSDPGVSKLFVATTWREICAVSVEWDKGASEESERARSTSKEEGTPHVTLCHIFYVTGAQAPPGLLLNDGSTTDLLLNSSLCATYSIPIIGIIAYISHISLPASQRVELGLHISALRMPFLPTRRAHNHHRRGTI
jgi:hypothetical protein